MAIAFITEHIIYYQFHTVCQADKDTMMCLEEGRERREVVLIVLPILSLEGTWQIVSLFVSESN